jgi:hypothetical protein
VPNALSYTRDEEKEEEGTRVMKVTVSSGCCATAGWRKPNRLAKAEGRYC